MAAAKRKLLLLGWDAADWKIISPLIDAGQMPNLERLLNEGTMGDLATLQPMLSPMIWNSVSTGVLPDKHGILGFSQVDSITGSVRPFSTVDRKVKAVWNILSQQGLRTNAVNWFASHPAEPINGIFISELFSASSLEKVNGPLASLPKGTVHPPELLEQIVDFRVAADEIDADQIGLFVRNFGEVDQTKDPHLVTLAKLLAECFTTHAATTWVMENSEWDFMAAYYPAIDHFCHAFMKFHPPRQSHISEREFELYHDVINSVYRLHDLLLGRLLQLAGEDATIVLCSDHGYHSDHLRPRYTLQQTNTAAAAEHRPLGIFVIKGPGIRKDALIHGASVMDIAPTILHLFGLPVGVDMPGKPLLDSMEQPSAVQRIKSWENQEGPAGLLDRRLRVDASDYSSLLKQFAALGYMPEHAGGDADFAETTLLENKWNLARVYAGTGRVTQALPLLEDIYEQAPLRLEFALHFADCLFRLGLEVEAGEVIENLIAIQPDRPITRLYRGMLEFERGNIEAAASQLGALEKNPPATPVFFNYLGFCFLRMSRTTQAQAAFAHALMLDPHNSSAMMGQARCLLLTGDNDGAVRYALQALGVNFGLTDGHYYLGIALARLGNLDRAAQAFETCLRIDPKHVAAHRCLIRVYTAMPSHAERVLELRAAYCSNSQSRLAPQVQIDRIRREMRERARLRHQARKERDAALFREVASGKRETYVPESPKTFVIVSGLPRSGTSLLMQMLHAGGLPALTDGQRTPDIDNPEGYLEWEAIKNIGAQPSLIEHAERKAVKVISMLLPQLPAGHHYKILFMDRPPEQVAASQARMIRRASERETIDETMVEKLRNHRDDILRLLEQAPHVEYCIVDYPTLISSPASEIERITRFVGDCLPFPARMKACIRPELFRNRSDNRS